MKIDTEKIKLKQLTLTQRELAKAAGLSLTAYNGILARGKCHPTSLVKIAKALGVNPEELIKRDY